jgi:hypothetical protein
MYVNLRKQPVWDLLEYKRKYVIVGRHVDNNLYIKVILWAISNF